MRPCVLRESGQQPSCFGWGAFAPASVAGRASAAASVGASMVIVSSHIAKHRDAIGAGVIVAIEPHRIRAVAARRVADNGPVTIWIEGRPLAPRSCILIDSDRVRVATWFRKVAPLRPRYLRN
jgi:hypothetical protein